MIPSEVLIKGRDFLQEHKWGKGDYHNIEKSSYCVVGSLYCGVFGENYWNEIRLDTTDYDIREAVWSAETYLNNVAPTGSAAVFNDSKAKRKRDVISLYNKALKKAQQEGN